MDSTVSGTISEQEFLAAHRLHRRRLVRRQLLVHGVLVVLGLLVASTLHTMVGLVIVGMGAGGLVAELVLSRFALPRRHKKTYRQQVSLRQKFTCTWNAEGLQATSEAGHVARAWRDYVKTLEDGRVFLLYQSDVLFEILPKSWFSSAEQIESFRRLSQARQMA